MKFGLTMLRWLMGPLFFGHGTQKLFGWFGGNGREATGQFFEQIGLKPGARHALAAGAAEAGGGALITLGLFTPAAAATLIGVMTTAIRKVHFKNGPWSTNGGYEYNLVLIGAMVALADLGPGELSLDSALGIELNGPLVALLALVGGAAGSTVLTRAPAAGGSPEPTPAPPAPDGPAAAEPAPAESPAAAEPAPIASGSPPAAEPAPTSPPADAFEPPPVAPTEAPAAPAGGANDWVPAEG
jgi:putative oxidoreductase